MGRPRGRAATRTVGRPVELRDGRTRTIDDRAVGLWVAGSRFVPPVGAQKLIIHLNGGDIRTLGGLLSCHLLTTPPATTVRAFLHDPASGGRLGKSRWLTPHGHHTKKKPQNRLSRFYSLFHLWPFFLFKRGETTTSTVILTFWCPNKTRESIKLIRGLFPNLEILNFTSVGKKSWKVLRRLMAGAGKSQGENNSLIRFGVVFSPYFHAQGLLMGMLCVALLAYVRESAKRLQIYGVC